jgi:hypothetical protein
LEKVDYLEEMSLKITVFNGCFEITFIEEDGLIDFREKLEKIVSSN